MAKILRDRWPLRCRIVASSPTGVTGASATAVRRPAEMSCDSGSRLKRAKQPLVASSGDQQDDQEQRAGHRRQRASSRRVAAQQPFRPRSVSSLFVALSVARLPSTTATAHQRGDIARIRASSWRRWSTGAPGCHGWPSGGCGPLPGWDQAPEAQVAGRSPPAGSTAGSPGAREEMVRL